ncbi:MAG: Minf_1886 family protein [Gemmatimonadota bacterium]
MQELQFADGVLARIRAKAGDRYDERAYLFLLTAIEFLQTRFEVRRHVSGAELSWGCRDLALERFGLLARTVLGCWGVTSTADFGRLVYTLIEIGLLTTQPGDREEDFHGVFDFVEAFDGSYRIQANPKVVSS